MCAIRVGFENPHHVVVRTAVGPQVLSAGSGVSGGSQILKSIDNFFQNHRGWHLCRYLQPVFGFQGFGKQNPVVVRAAVGPQVLQRQAAAAVVHKFELRQVSTTVFRIPGLRDRARPTVFRDQSVMPLHPQWHN